jgi:hypothetical protein
MIRGVLLSGIFLSGIFVLVAAPSALAGPSQEARGRVRLSGLVHEAKPTETTALAGVRIEAIDGELAGQVFETDARGRFTLPPVSAGGFELALSKAGYATTRLRVGLAPPGELDASLMPDPRDVVVSRSGNDDCADLPPPPEGVPGIREYARLAVHHDGTLIVRAAQLPFFSNEGYVYRLTPGGWVRNEIDYVLLRSPIPVLGGFMYSITFGGGKDLCGAWSVDLTHPE